MTDWGALFLASLIGACLGWMACALWTARWIDAERRRMHEEIDPAIENLVRELEQLRLQEKFNRERA